MAAIPQPHNVVEHLQVNGAVPLTNDEFLISEAMFQRPAPVGVLGIGERWTPTFDANEFTVTRQMINYTKTVDYYTVSEERETAVVVATILKMIDQSENEPQLLASYLSAVTALFPGMKGVSESFLKNRGWNLVPVVLPTDATTHFITVYRGVDTTLTLMLLAQLLFLPFKNITELGYENFIRARMFALAGRVGYLFTDDTPIVIVLGLEKAQRIRALLGASASFRKTLVVALMNAVHSNTTHDMIKHMSDYVLSITAWTEMNAFTFIIENLVAPQSPVLQYKPMAMEVKALRIAVEAVKSVKWPQFFRVFADPSEYRLLARDRFPILAAVAGRLKLRDKKSAEKNVIAGATVDDRNKVDSDVVTFLVNLHNRSVGSAGKRRVHLEYLQYIYEEA